MATALLFRKRVNLCFKGSVRLDRSGQRPCISPVSNP
jgi:hypothetical protein